VVAQGASSAGSLCTLNTVRRRAATGKGATVSPHHATTCAANAPAQLTNSPHPTLTTLFMSDMLSSLSSLPLLLLELLLELLIGLL
jgi:hypothetical protein